MNKKGITILELLLSISLTSIVLLLLLKLIFSLDNINNNKNYASSDEISRTEIIKKIENDFLKLKLSSLEILNNKIVFTFKDNSHKELLINETSLNYNNESTSLKSSNATYSICPTYKYTKLENNYYFFELTIPVLINNENTTVKDDITLTYLGLLDESTDIPSSFTCSK